MVFIPTKPLPLKSFILFLCVPVLVLGGVRAEAQDGSITDAILFEDSIQESHKFVYYPVKPWTAGEKDIILKALSWAKPRVPGLFQRVTAYRPLKLFRTESGSSPFTVGKAMLVNNGIYFMDTLFKDYDDYGLEGVNSTFIHELVHLADSTLIAESDPNWSHLVRDRIDRVRQALKNEGLSEYAEKLPPQQRRKYAHLARKEGLPTLYSATKLGETLAETVEEMIVNEFQPPEPIGAYVHDNLLSTPYRPDAAIRAYHQALELYAQGKFSEAAQAFAGLSESHPDFKHTYYFSGHASTQNEDLDRALQDFSKALDAFRTVPAYAAILKADMGDILSNKERYDEAISHYTEAIKLWPSYVNAAFYSSRGTALFLTEKYDEAIADLTIAIENESGKADNYSARGHSFSRKKEYAKALEDYSKLVELKPDDDDSYYFRAGAYGNLNQSDKAIVDYTKAISLQPDNIGPYLSRAILYKKLNQPGQAIGDYSKMIELDPDNIVTYLSRAKLWNAVKKFDKEEADYAAALALDPDELDVYHARAASRMQRQGCKGAIPDYGAILERSPNSIMIRAERGKCRLETKEFDGAIADFRAMMKLNPRPMPDILLLRAQAYVESGRFKEAIEDLNKAKAAPWLGKEIKKWTDKANQGLAGK